MADTKATQEAFKLALAFVKKNPNHPASIQWLKQAASAGTLPAIRARQLTEQGVAPKTKQPMTKPLPKTVAAQTRAQKLKKK